MPKRCFLIVNPTSGSYSRRRIDSVITRLAEAGLGPELLLTRNAQDASLFAQRLCAEESAPYIVAGGGDGTVNGVINGLLPGKATLAVLPLGTANVLAKELGIHSIPEAVEKIVRRDSRPIAVGRLAATDSVKHFLLMAGIGFDGAVVEGVRLAEKRIIGKGAYALSALRVLAHWDKELFSISVDGTEHLCHGAIICKASRYGGNFILAPQVDIFTGGFQVICVENSGLTTYVRLLASLAAGRVPGAGISSVNGREIVIRGGKAIQLDGDFHCHAPVQISCVDNFLNIIV